MKQSSLFILTHLSIFYSMLMSVFSEDQLRRYEVYRRSALSKSAVRKASILDYLFIKI
jgi:hypothetical protein